MVRLYTSAWEAVAIALATFLGLIFIFAVLESTAWAPHLFTTLLALWAYWVLAASNARLLSFPDYVARGEVDAGFVYATDAQAMPDRVRRAFDVPVAGRIAYPLAVVQASTQPVEAKRFAAFVRSAQGQAILQKHGFGKP